MKQTTNILLIVLAGLTDAFVPGRPSTTFQRRLLSNTVSDVDAVVSSSEDIQESTIVRAPLKFIGPYPCLSLRFPELATESQRESNVSGISLDFVLDTAANTNTINGDVANQLKLEQVGEALPGVGAVGAIEGGTTFLLGDCELEGLPKEENFTFMVQLTASALPVASPASAGLLSLAFLQCFEGGVEFKWGSMQDGSIASLPAVTFYGQKHESEEIVQSMTRVPIERIPVTQLPSVTISINGVEMPALLDTGSPITVLNAQAARIANVDTIDLDVKESKNPFSNMANNFKLAQAAAKGEVLTLTGAGGKRVDLLRSGELVEVALVGDSKAEFGKGHIFVGDLPGLAALNGIGVDSPPAVVLGMDVLRCRPGMLLRARTNELFVK